MYANAWHGSALSRDLRKPKDWSFQAQGSCASRTKRGVNSWCRVCGWMEKRRDAAIRPLGAHRLRAMGWGTSIGRRDMVRVGTLARGVLVLFVPGHLDGLKLRLVRLGLV